MTTGHSASWASTFQAEVVESQTGREVRNDWREEGTEQVRMVAVNLVLLMDLLQEEGTVDED